LSLVTISRRRRERCAARRKRRRVATINVRLAFERVEMQIFVVGIIVYKEFMRHW
jgi:hypothetical protein